jgi:hypothetical protein
MKHRIFLIALPLALLTVLRSQTTTEKIGASFKQLDHDQNG